MGAYAEQIKRLPLFKVLSGRDGGDAVKLAGMILAVADDAGPLLSRIPMTFKQYTEHDLGHSVNLIRLMGQFIPKATKKDLSDIEIAVLMISAILHDFGMYVEPEEKAQYLASEHFQTFLASSPDKQRAIEEAQTTGRHAVVRAIEDATLADYFRKHHPERAATNIDRFFAGKLVLDGFDLAPDIKRICESHGWPVFENNDPNAADHTIARGLKSRAPVNGISFNQQYIACCLRLADIMDFDRSRTPVAILRTITDERSQAEWQKHMQIRGWDISERVVEYQASCRHPEHYVAVMEFLDAVDDELTKCRRLVVRDAPRDIAEKYTLHLPAAVDRMPVEMEDKSYIAGGFRFELEYERILKLLMDKSLYPDSSLFLRELLQNSLDACRFRRAIAQSEGGGDKYEPHIVVWDKSHDASPRIEFQDNGIGMSEDVIKNYFMRVGRSFYRSGEFNAQRQRLAAQGIQLEATSQFGIGILSCFMVADRIEIETYRLNETPLHISIEGPTKYFVIRRLEAPKATQVQSLAPTPEADGPPQYAGTKVTVHLRPDVTINVAGVMETFCSNLECDVVIVTTGGRQTIEAWGWEKGEVEVEPNLKGILIRSDVPLAPFGLRGRAWFWFLRDDDGSPVPEKGYLKIGDMLSVEGEPAVMAGMKGGKSLWEALAKRIDEEFAPEVGSETRFAELWNRYDRRKRLALIEWQRRLSDDQRSWSMVPGLPEALARGDDSWIEAGVATTTGGYFSSPESISLHGIELPAAITQWSPMTGRSDRIRLLDFRAGFEVDHRGSDAPVPAANRLFIDPSEARKIGVPLARAFLRHAVDLLSVRSQVRAWQTWFNAFVESIGGERYWPQAVWLERDTIRRYLRVPLISGRRWQSCDVETLRAELGRFARVAMFDEQAAHVAAWSTATAILMVCQQVRRDGDHVVIDLDEKGEMPDVFVLNEVMRTYFRSS